MSRESSKIRRNNSDKIMKMMFHKRKAVKAEMSEVAGISVVTINSLVSELVAENHLIRGAYQKQETGRPAMEYHFNYDKVFYLLISIQEKQDNQPERELEAVIKVVNMEGTEVISSKKYFNDISIKSIGDIIDEYTHEKYEIGKIGISIPGKISNGVITSSWYGRFDGWNIKKALHEVTHLPIEIQNDAHIITMGICLEKDIPLDQSIVGFFYPEKSMPGITIFSKNQLIEGRNGLAGEAKYLPMLMDRKTPDTAVELADNLSKIMAVYNVVIAPDVFIIATQNVDEDMIKAAIENDKDIQRQPNAPEICFGSHFQNSITHGLLWLVTKDTIYKMN
ncbi:ROK family protein [Corticicoccus populi]|uniref:ROK family protein n=1 Tax=Corticicoccus populi TaxID=1812821 RepID=A0ABW5WYD5_9STAP